MRKQVLKISAGMMIYGIRGQVQNGTPLEVLQELGGWKDIKSVQRYAHFNVDTLRGYAKRPGIETKKATMASGF